MIKKIEITQRFNFKKLNRHYECFIIDLESNMAYYRIHERFSDEKYIEKSILGDNSWVDIFSELKSNITSQIYHFDDVESFFDEFNNLELFKDFKSENFAYFEKIENIYSCNVIIYGDSYEEFSFKNYFPKNWVKFGELLIEFLGIDVLHLNFQKQMVTGLFFDVLKDGVYLNNSKLELKSLEFGHYSSLEMPHVNFIVDFNRGHAEGYFEKELDDLNIIYDLLEDYGVYLWGDLLYQEKSHNFSGDAFDGHNWYLEMIFKDNIIWHVFGFNEYPDTYVDLAVKLNELTGYDLLELNSIDPSEIEVFNKYSKNK